MINRLWSYRLWDIWQWKYQKNCRVSKKISKSWILKGWYLANGIPEPNNPYHFLKELNKPKLRRRVVLITTAQRHSAKSGLQFCVGSNPAIVFRLEKKLSTFRWSIISQKQFMLMSKMTLSSLSTWISFFYIKIGS